MVTDRDFFPLAEWNPNIVNPADLSTYAQTYELEFWSAGHGISPGDAITLELPSDTSREFVSVLEGTVNNVAEHKISVAGTERISSTDAGEH